MTFKQLQYRIPQLISWLIVLKGITNLLLGVLFFFLSLKMSDLHYISFLSFFWDFSPTKSLTAITMGCVYIFLGRGLYQGKKMAWRIALVWLCLNLIDSAFPRFVIFQFAYTSIIIITLWLTRAYFNRQGRNPLRSQQIIAFFSILFVLAYGVIGCYLLRAQYHGLHSLTDAIYYSLVTYSTIGYGDIVPITDHAKIFTCSMIILGVSSFVAAISILLGPAMEQRMKKVVNMVNKLSMPQNHVIVAGATTLSLHTAKALRAKGVSIIIIDPSVEQLKLSTTPEFKTMAADPSLESTLEAANLKAANAIICAFNDDAQNLLVTMVAHNLKQRLKLKFKIIVRVDEPQNVPFATQNGADQVISPALILGDLVVKALS